MNNLHIYTFFKDFQLEPLGDCVRADPRVSIDDVTSCDAYDNDNDVTYMSLYPDGEIF